MSSNAASALFLQCYRRAASSDADLDGEVALLAKVELTDPSTRTLYLATRQVVTPDKQVWEPSILSASPLNCPGEWLSPGVDLVSGDVTLARRRLGWQAVGDDLFDTFVQFQWYGAVITFYLWLESIGARGGTFAADALPVLVGARMNRPVLTPTTAKVSFRQSTAWRRRVPVRSVNKVDYPARPVSSDGVPIPIVVGDFRNIGMRNPPWASPYTYSINWEASGAGSGVVPGVVVDTGIGGAKVKVLFASHELKTINGFANGYTLFLRADRILAVLDNTGVTSVASALEGGITVDDEKMIGVVAVQPTDVRVTSPNLVNTAGDPRNALEVMDETSYAVLDQNTGKNGLQLFLPNLSPLGYALSVDALVAFSGDAANTHNLRVYPYNPQTNGSGTAVAGAATGTVGTTLSGAWDAAWWTRQWDFGGNTGGSSVVDIRVDFAGGTTNKARIYWVVLIVTYQPNRGLVTPGAQRGFFHGGVAPGATRQRGVFKLLTPGIAPVYDFEGDMLANVAGAKDDGSGTYTGSVAGLIQVAPDVAHWLLRTYGGVASGDVETGAGAFGAFGPDARALVRDGQPGNWNVGVHVGQFTDLGSILTRLAEQSLSLLELDRFTGKWRFLPWQNGARVDYDRIVQRDDVFEFEAECTSDTEIVQAIRLQFRQDYFRNRATLEALVTPDVSTRGYNDAEQKDENCVVVVNVNDDLDWVGAATYADVLTAGTYTPIALATEVRTQMRTHDANMHFGYGFQLRAGEKIDFKAGGGALAATVAATSDNPAATAIEAERALNVAAAGTGRTFAVVYLYDTNKFKVTATGGNFELLGATGANYASSALATLGIVADSGAVTTYTATINRYGGRYWDYTKTGNTTFKWKTGASAATNCGHLLGYGRSADSGATASHGGTYQVGDRQQQAAASVATYGEKKEQLPAGDFIREEAVAGAYLKRLFDLSSRQRARVRFATRRMPDVRRGAVIELSSDFDAWVPFPRSGSDGSWARKPMRVVAVEASQGPLWHQRVVAVEA